MGLIQSKDSETINWNNIKTNEMSSTLPNLNGISFEAEQLLSKLNLPEISETNSDFDSNLIFNKFNQDIKNENTGDDVSSPFISSEMYNYLVNKYNNTNNMVGGAKIDDDDTSSTSSSSSEKVKLESEEDNELESEEDNELESEEVKSKKQPKKEKQIKKKDTDDTDEINQSNNKNYEGKRKINKSKKTKKSYKGSETYLSYVSSSAHTGGSISETIPNENNYSISSVNTSDLNYISDN